MTSISCFRLSVSDGQSILFASVYTLQYPGSRGRFSKYLILYKPCIRFDKAPETEKFFSLGALRLVDAALPRTINIVKKKISSGTQGNSAVYFRIYIFFDS